MYVYIYSLYTLHFIQFLQLDELNLIQTDIKTAIIDTITSQCDCHFNESAIIEDEFTCRYSNSYFTYRVKIAVHSRTFPLAAEEYVNYIRNWVKSGRASFLSERRRLWVDESCDINITSFTDPECRPGNIIKSREQAYYNMFEQNNN